LVVVLMVLLVLLLFRARFKVRVGYSIASVVIGVRLLALPYSASSWLPRSQVVILNVA
jgi:uncharacterized membrane protein YccF (DUF307 family)